MNERKYYTLPVATKTSAWADCMRILTRMEIEPPQNGKVASGEEKIETVRSDKSQATIANFFQKNENE